MPIKITDIAKISNDSTLWDEGKGAVSGFGARRQKGETVAYFLKYRTLDGRQRWLTIGRDGAPWTPDMARKEARRVLGEVAKGRDPAGEKQSDRKAETVADLCELYRSETLSGRILTRSRMAKKPSTIDGDRGRIDRHIVPLIGSLKVASVTRRDVEKFYEAVAAGATAATIKTGKQGLARITGGRGTATRALGLLGAIFAFAIDRGLRTDNPTAGVVRHAYVRRDRRMSDDEYAALSRALNNQSANIWPFALVATKFLLITGWRRGEVLNLQWTDIDLQNRTARLSDTKTGRSLRPLSKIACEIIEPLPHMGSFVFPSSAGNMPMTGYAKIYKRIADSAGLSDDVTPHVFRHSFASVAADLGYSEPVIAGLIGHKGQSVTSRYIHSADTSLLAAADAVASRIDKLMS